MGGCAGGGAVRAKRTGIPEKRVAMSVHARYHYSVTISSDETTLPLLKGEYRVQLNRVQKTHS